MANQQPGYTIGAGVPVNQQYLQPHEARPTSSHSDTSHQQQDPSYGGAPNPQSYNPQAPDIPAGGYGAYSPSQGSYTGSQSHDQQVHYQQESGHFPPPQSSTGAQQYQQYPPPPRDAGPQGSYGQQAHHQQESGHFPPPPPNPTGAQQYSYQQYPPIPSADGGQTSGTQQYPPPPMGSSPGLSHQHEFPPPPSADSTPQGYGQSYQPGLDHSQQYPPPPTSQSVSYRPQPPSQGNASDATSSIIYTRDPHRLTVYLIPFPKPHLKGTPPEGIPDRFLIYTPPAPPIPKPAEGEKEAKLQKVQRKWQEEVRAAKTSTAKTASWQGVKSKATRGISKAVNLTTSSNLDFINRIPDGKSSPDRRHSEDGIHETEETHKTVGLQEMVLIYPSSYAATPDQVKTELINTMMRSKSKAQRDAIIATGLLPVSAAIDILATVIWPFGGLLEVDGVWAYSSIRGAKTARSVTKRLTSSTKHGVTHHDTEEQEMQGDKLHMSFQQDPRVEVLYRYLCTTCTKRDARVFPSTGTATTESEVLEAIGWAPSQTGREKNWEDEQWETSEVKDDLRNVMGKGAREWDKWCREFEKSPEKAMKK